MQENRIRIDFGWKSFLSFFGSRPQARTCEKFWKKYILKIHQIYVQYAKAGPENAREQNSNRFWLKKFPFIFWLKAAGADLWKVLKKIYFENPPILCSIATAGPENAREQNSNRFWLKKFHFIFWPKAAGADLWKVLKKIYFENPPILCSIATAGPENAREQHSNRFWLKKFPFIFWLKAAGADLWKVLKKIYFENPQILCSFAKAGPENANEQHLNRFWLKKFPFIFWPQGRRRGPVKSSEKNIFWKSTNFMFNSNSRPWKCKRTEFESILVEKVSFHFWLKAAGADLRKVWKNIYFKNPQILCSIATAGHENAREQNWNQFWLKKFHFIFWLKAQAQTCEKFCKKYILKIHKFYVQ